MTISRDPYLTDKCIDPISKYGHIHKFWVAVSFGGHHTAHFGRPLILRSHPNTLNIHQDEVHSQVPGAASSRSPRVPSSVKDVAHSRWEVIREQGDGQIQGPNSWALSPSPSHQQPDLSVPQFPLK